MKTNTTASYNDIGNESLCGLPPFCSSDAIYQCQEHPLKHCPACSVSSASGILSLLIITGVLIMIGNTIVLLVTANIEKKNKTKRDYAKMSLAVTDFIKGLNLLAVGCPHLLQALNSTVIDLQLQVELSRGSVRANALGVVMIFIYTSSLYHLLYMSVQRFLAIQLPFKYRQVTTNQTIFHLIGVWIISLVTASIMAWNHSSNNFVYHPSVFQFFFGFSEGSLRYSELVPMAILFLVPCLFMTLITVITTHLACWKIRKSRTMRQSRSKTKSLKQEFWMFRLTFLMNISYLVGVVPCLVVMVLFYVGKLTCSTISLPFFISFYLGSGTGLVDVLVYSIYERNFRTEVYDFFARIFNLKRRRSDSQRKGFDTRPVRVTTIKKNTFHLKSTSKK